MECRQHLELKKGREGLLLKGLQKEDTPASHFRSSDFQN